MLKSLTLVMKGICTQVQERGYVNEMVCGAAIVAIAKVLSHMFGPIDLYIINYHIEHNLLFKWIILSINDPLPNSQ